MIFGFLLGKKNPKISKYIAKPLIRFGIPLSVMGLLLEEGIDIHTTWRLNEKHYGTLEGIPRQYIRDIYGDKFTKMMRGNFSMKPPILDDNELGVFRHTLKDSLNPPVFTPFFINLSLLLNRILSFQANLQKVQKLLF